VHDPVLILNILFAALSDGAYSLVVGCLLAGYWLGAAVTPEHPASSVKAAPARGLRQACLAGVVALVVAQLVRPWFASASMSGSSSFMKNLALIPDVLSSTHQGKVWYVGSAALLALLAATFFPSQKATAVTTSLFFASLLVIAGAKAASGHAANGGDFTLAEFSMLLHVLSVAVWSGAVLASGLLVLPYLAHFRDPAAFWSYGTLLSKTATWALLALLASGVYTSDRELNGTLSGLWRSGWGRILMIKATFVLAALTLGALSRFRCLQRPATSQRVALMVRLVRTEAMVMICILCLSAILANTPPAMTESSKSWQWEIPETFQLAPVQPSRRIQCCFYSSPR